MKFRDYKIVALSVVITLLIVGSPSIAATVRRALFAENAGKVNGFRAVKSSTPLAKRRSRLVVTGASGRLPNNIISKAPNANRLDGSDSTVFLKGRQEYPAGGTSFGNSLPFEVDGYGTFSIACADGTSSVTFTSVSLISDRNVFVDTGEGTQYTRLEQSGAMSIGPIPLTNTDHQEWEFIGGAENAQVNLNHIAQAGTCISYLRIDYGEDQSL